MGFVSMVSGLSRLPDLLEIEAMASISSFSFIFLIHCFQLCFFPIPLQCCHLFLHLLETDPLDSCTFSCAPPGPQLDTPCSSMPFCTSCIPQILSWCTQ